MKGVELTWTGGEHEFKLTIDLLRALQDKCDAGPPHILQRLSARQWLVDDVISTIRLGLEGGGMDKEKARQLVRAHVEDRPLTQSVLTAQAILVAALFGVEDDMPGEKRAGEGQSKALSREESGGSPPSTDGPASSVSTSGE